MAGVAQFKWAVEGVLSAALLVGVVLAAGVLLHLAFDWALNWSAKSLHFNAPEFIKFFLPYVVPIIAMYFLALSVHIPPISAEACAPKTEWIAGFTPSIDQQTGRAAVQKHVVLTRRVEMPYRMKIVGREGGLQNLNVGWEGWANDKVSKLEPSPPDGIHLILTNPVGLVAIEITPAAMANTKLDISYECIR